MTEDHSHHRCVQRIRRAHGARPGRRRAHRLRGHARDRRPQRAQAAAAARPTPPSTASTLRPDRAGLSDPASVDAAVAAVIAEHGRIDVIIHNAGHMVLGPTEAFTPEQIAAVYDTNVLSTQRVNRAVLPRLRAQGDGLVLWVGTQARAAAPRPTSARTSRRRRQRTRSRSATPPSSPGSGSRRRSSCPARSRRAPTTSPTPDAPPTSTSRRPTKPSTRGSWTRSARSWPNWHPTMPILRGGPADRESC